MDTLIKTGKPSPDITLADLAGKKHRLKDYRGKIVIINFWSAECPWTKRTDEAILPMLQVWGDKVVLLSIASNANETIDEITQTASEWGVELILLDTDQATAKAYGALTTPHMFVVDTQGVLRYQGAFDDVTFRQRESTVNYLHRSVEALLSDELPELGEVPSYGCTVVYHRA